MCPSKWSDQAIERVEDDRLHFSDYAVGISEVIKADSSPLTIGIHGSWGSGKSSLMLLVKSLLDQRRDATHKSFVTIWFNAWKHSKEDALWRALILQVLETIRNLDKKDDKLRSSLDDLEASLYSNVDRTEPGKLTINWGDLLKGASSSAIHLSISLIPGIGNALSKLVESAQSEVAGKDVSTLLDAFHREQINIHKNQVLSTEQFQDQFAEIVDKEIKQKNRVLIIFVDDLDRCLPDKVLDMLEAIKLFLEVEGCVFILGADRQLIERSIELKYKTFGLQEHGLPTNGTEYLDKIIHLSFHLPPLRESEVVKMVESYEDDLPSDCSWVFATGAEANPRKVKRALNLFRLYYQLCQIRAVSDVRLKNVSGPLLAKLTVIRYRYPDLFLDLAQYPNLIIELERRSRMQRTSPVLVDEKIQDEDSGSMSEIADKYSSNIQYNSLNRLLRRGISFASTAIEEIQTYIYLIGTEIPKGDFAENFEIDSGTQSDIFSNDIVKIASGVNRLAPDSRQDLKAQLIQIIEMPDVDTTKRMSADIAVSLIDSNENNIIEMVDISGGELVHLNNRFRVKPLKVSKFPITNAIYYEFIKANPEYPVPYKDEEWATSYNWDKTARIYPIGMGNLPVVLVNYFDAEAFCKWKKVRLLSSFEWEWIAIGDSQRIYPWGNEFDPKKCNCKESGFGHLTSVKIYSVGKSIFDIYDLSGNTWEWTTTDSDDGKILKGGCWASSPDEVKVSSQLISSPGRKHRIFSFRIAKD